MKVTFYILIPLYLVVLFANCKIDQRYSEDKNHRTILASADATCKVAAVEPLYSFLFGLLPVFRKAEPNLPAGQTLRITEVTNWKDYAVTLVGGWAITLVRRTRTIEFCEENLFANSWNPEKQSVDQTLYQLAASGKVSLYLKSGEFLSQVKILAFDESSIDVEALFPDPNGGFTDRAILRDGSSIDGRQLGQDDKEVLMENLDGKKITIQKSNLHKIDMRVPKTIREKKNFLKADISKIAFEDSLKK
ncbi:hypothetical protein JWG44_12890 [Leptospira sp. 201903071]|uniref:LIC_13076 family protein n=1 Tax=Leptospira ainazelensis TaxID=2810034 RepID=UPI001964F88F|nr:hypothetical protein [Leptospira ainazelensis]MBM9501149.1 hypothetical protein [Leptospira ainazelensis]